MAASEATLAAAIIINDTQQVSGSSNQKNISFITQKIVIPCLPGSAVVATPGTSSRAASSQLGAGGRGRGILGAGAGPATKLQPRSEMKTMNKHVVCFQNVTMKNDPKH